MSERLCRQKFHFLVHQLSLTVYFWSGCNDSRCSILRISFRQNHLVITYTNSVKAHCCGIIINKNKRYSFLPAPCRKELPSGPTLSLSEVMRDEIWAPNSSLVIKLRKDMQMFTCAAPPSDSLKSGQNTPKKQYEYFYLIRIKFRYGLLHFLEWVVNKSGKCSVKSFSCAHKCVTVWDYAHQLLYFLAGHAPFFSCTSV